MKLRALIPVLFLFVLTNTILVFSNTYFGTSTAFKFRFIMVVNLMLFTMSIFSFNRIRKIDYNNPRSVVNSVMIGTLLKMVFFAGAALAYASQKLGPVGMPTLLSSMGLYLIYTWLEISWTQHKQ
jgi:hypothetical protein